MDGSALGGEGPAGQKGRGRRCGTLEKTGPGTGPRVGGRARGRARRHTLPSVPQPRGQPPARLSAAGSGGRGPHADTGLLPRYDHLPAGASHHPGPEVTAIGPQSGPAGTGRGRYLAVSSADRRVQDEVGRRDHIHQGDSIVFQLWENKVLAWQRVSMATVEEQSPEFVAGPASNRNPGVRPDSGSVISSLAGFGPWGTPEHSHRVAIHSNFQRLNFFNKVSFCPARKGLLVKATALQLASWQLSSELRV